MAPRRRQSERLTAEEERVVLVNTAAVGKEQAPETRTCLRAGIGNHWPDICTAFLETDDNIIYFLTFVTLTTGGLHWLLQMQIAREGNILINLQLSSTVIIQCNY